MIRRFGLIACLDDADFLQQDLERLVQWSEKWLLKFNPSKCKVMHIGHNLNTSYIMKDGNHTAELESTDKEKDLGIYVTKDLKSQEQRVQTAKKAWSVLGMVKRHFKVIDKEDFMVLYKTYIRPHLEYQYCVQIWSPHLKKDIECLERIQRRPTKLVKGLKQKSYQEWLKILGLHSLQQRRLRGDLIETYKILTGKECVNSCRLRGSRFCQGVRQLLGEHSSVQESAAIGTRCHAMLLKLRLWMHSRTDWTSTGQIWASKA